MDDDDFGDFEAAPMPTTADLNQNLQDSEPMLQEQSVTAVPAQPAPTTTPETESSPEPAAIASSPPHEGMIALAVRLLDSEFEKGVLIA